MGAAAILGATMGGLSAASTLVGGAAADRQQNAQRQAQADALQQQAKLTQEQGRIEAENISGQRSRIRREYESIQGQNRVALGAGNVDLSSGSAMKVQEGNSLRFADDIGENEYNRLLSQWSTNEKVKQTQAQADYYSQTVNNSGVNLLTAGLTGLQAGLSGYSLAGGIFGNAASSAPRYVNIAPASVDKMGIEMWAPVKMLK